MMTVEVKINDRLIHKLTFVNQVKSIKNRTVYKMTWKSDKGPQTIETVVLHKANEGALQLLMCGLTALGFRKTRQTTLKKEG